MVKQIKEAGAKTSTTIKNVFEVIMLVATAAVAIKALSSDQVSTASGNLPLWQVAAAIVLAAVAYKMYQLQSK